MNLKKLNIWFCILAIGCASHPIKKERIRTLLISPQKVEKNTTKLRLDGFYYAKFIQPLRSKKDSIKYIAPAILYNNGAANFYDYIGNGISTFNERKKYKKDDCYLKQPNLENHNTVINHFQCIISKKEYRKESFGIYSIEHKSIKFQFYYKKKLYKMNGSILNDTTFLIHKRINYSNNKIENVNEHYYFQKSKVPKQPKIAINGYF